MIRRCTELLALREIVGTIYPTVSSCSFTVGVITNLIASRTYGTAGSTNSLMLTKVGKGQDNTTHLIVRKNLGINASTLKVIAWLREGSIDCTGREQKRSRLSTTLSGLVSYDDRNIAPVAEQHANQMVIIIADTRGNTGSMLFGYVADATQLLIILINLPDLRCAGRAFSILRSELLLRATPEDRPAARIGFL
jgi:hypothetical protein